MTFRSVSCLTAIACSLIFPLSCSTLSAAESADARQLQASVAAPLHDRFAPRLFAGGPDAAQAGWLGKAQVPRDDVAVETPDFQKHISPLLGRLGCNGRACHGSFQGQGGFQLSLFGYDFESDYEALLEDGAARVDLDDKPESMILTKPVDEDMHDGGKRYEHGGWEYWVLRTWIERGAPFDAKQVHQLDRLEVLPRELSFTNEGQQQQLKAIAHWSDGTSEDVTCLCRFQSNDSGLADVDEAGLVTSKEAGDTHVVVSYDNAVVPVLALRPTSDHFGDQYPQLATRTEIDRLIAQKLKKLGIVPSDLCTDEEFLRRASLDVTGTLPSAEEVVAFINDTSPDKRSQKINELLNRPGYAAQWTTFLCDMTGNNEDQLRNFLPQQVKLSEQWYQWIYSRVADNVPYDQIVEGIVTATSRLPDESYAEYCEAMSEICRDKSGEMFADRPGLVHYWARRNFRTAEERAIGFAYSFLGVRIQCAQCHKHPFDQWSKTDFDNFERLFGRVQAAQNSLAPDAKKEYKQMVSTLGLDEKLRGNQLRRELGSMLADGKVVPLPELVVRKPPQPRNNQAAKSQKATQPQAKLLGGEWIALDEVDVRGKLMQWLRSADNPYFSKAIVNRIWANYFGIGIVNPPDDLNLANAPSNGPLLDYLAKAFTENGYDLKWLHRKILNSDAYQRSWIPNETNAGDKTNFSHSQLRRLSAEATYDAVRMALANTQLADKARELDTPRAITKAGASARNNSRDDESYALTVFGRSIRESNCDCDRSSEPSLLQTVFLANDKAVQDWLNDPKTSWVSEVAERFGWEKRPAGPAAEAQRKRQAELLARLVAQIENAEELLGQAREKGREKQIKLLRKRKADVLKRARQAAKKNDLSQQLEDMLDHGSAEETSETAEVDSGRMSEEQALWVAENAYLRSLSRRPSDDELFRIVGYLTSEENPTLAVEGLMWSLINTKEFILNH